MTPEQLREHCDQVSVEFFANGLYRLTSDKRLHEPLPPHLWEAVRLKLQEHYRAATGEPDAVLEERP